MEKRTSITSPSDMNTSKYYNDKKYVGVNSYYKGNKKYQCTMFVNARSSEIAGKPITYWNGTSKKSDIEKPLFNRYGFPNACNWLKETNWETGNEARVGAIMVYGTAWGSGCGHVRIVEEIRGNKLFVSGGNEDGKGSIAFKEIDMPKISSSGFIGYIYNPYVKESTTKTIKQKLLEKISELKNIVEEL